MTPATTPSHEIDLGRIRARIWENVGGEGVRWWKVTIACRYKRGDTWQETSSFHRDDLPLVELAAQKAYAWILEHDRLRSSPTLGTS